MSITLRQVGPEDEDFLFELFRQTVGEELKALGDPILRMQFRAQAMTYRAEFPRADHQIILLDDRPIGRVMVERIESENRGVDIALLSEYRSGGIGGMLIQELLDEAARAGKPFRISVVKSNPAMRLYERLGFQTIGATETQFLMEWLSPNEGPNREPNQETER
jgi:GNAT superfamily N-acetyltransferase